MCLPVQPSPLNRPFVDEKEWNNFTEIEMGDETQMLAAKRALRRCDHKRAMSRIQNSPHAPEEASANTVLN